MRLLESDQEFEPSILPEPKCLFQISIIVSYENEIQIFNIFVFLDLLKNIALEFCRNKNVISGRTWYINLGRNEDSLDGHMRSQVLAENPGDGRVGFTLELRCNIEQLHECLPLLKTLQGQ